MEDIYFKQKNLYNPHEEQPNIIVYGAGSIGSHLVAGLTKTGFKNITVYDYDIIEQDNLPAQFYSYEAVKSKTPLKVLALQKFIKEFTGTDITVSNAKISKGFCFDLSMNSIHIVCFDNIEGRKVIFDALKGYQVHFLDGRIGGFNLEKYYLLMSGEDNSLEAYDKTLQGEFTELECGNKTLWGVNSLLTSKMIADVIKITKKQPVTGMYKTSLMADIAINGELK